MAYVPPAHASVPEWMRIVASALNPALNGYPYPQFDAAPGNPEKGFTYYDTVLNKVRTWDGTAWNNHW